VIVGIIVGSVIVIAILACIINCICCGYQCCKGCCSCCCPSGRRRNKQPKHYDDLTYHLPPPPAPNPTYQAPPAPPVYRGANTTAIFDSSSKSGATSMVNEDSLPAMPTWAGAVDKRVEDHTHEDVEMEPLNPPDRRQGAGTPGHPGTALSDYPPDRGTPLAGYRGFNPTDPYARRSPGPAAALAATQDPYGRRSPGAPHALNTSPIDPYGRRSPGLASPAAAAVDPYDRRSPGLASAMDPYGRRSPGALTPSPVDPYNRRSPGPTSPVGVPMASSPYEHQPYQQPYDDYNTGGYHALTSPSPVAAYNPQTNYSPVPMALTPSTEPRSQTLGFTRQPSFGSSQYPPTYTSQPPYRDTSPSIPNSPPPPFQSQAPSEYTPYNGQAHAPQEQTHQYGLAISEPSRDRPPSLLVSGRKPAPNTFRDV